MKKGISLVSLIAYIVILTVILGMIAAFNSNTLSQAYDYMRVAKMDQEYQNLTMFLVNIVNKENCRNVKLEQSGTVLNFYDGAGNSIAKIRHDAGARKIFLSTAVNENREITISQYVDDFDCRISSDIYTIASGEDVIKVTLEVDIGYKLNNAEFTPITPITYVLGRGY